MDVSQHFYCDTYSAHYWEHGHYAIGQMVTHMKVNDVILAEKGGCKYKGMVGTKCVTTRYWQDHVAIQFATTRSGRREMKMAADVVTRIPDLYGKKHIEPLDPVSWIVDGNVFILDMFMSYFPRNSKYDLCNKKHVRLYIDRGQGPKILGWENWDDTITKMTIDKGGNVALTVLEDKKRKRYAWESDSDSELGDDSDFSEDEDGYAIPKRTRKVMDSYRVKKTTILNPQEFATAIFNEHEDLHFFVDQVRNVTMRPRRIGLLVLCKMLLKVRRLHYQAIGRKWAPGGVEYVKHMDCETANKMLAPYRDSDPHCRLSVRPQTAVDAVV